jgi:predicted porin
VKNNIKMVAAACALVAACGAQAQPLTRFTNNVTMYGIVDSGVERLTNVGPTRATLVRVPTLSASLPSRIGFRGAEDLGGGLWAQFVLETGIGIDSGVINQGGRFFGRQSFVGLSHNTWGTLTFGRQYDGFYLATLDSGIFGPNAYGLGSLDNYIPAARFDNTIAYQNAFGDFAFGANYSLGRDVVGGCPGETNTDVQRCRAASGWAKYTTQGWGVATGYSKQRGAPGAAGGLVRSDLDDQRLTVNGYVRGSNWKVGGGWIGRDNEGVVATQQKSNLFWVEGAYAIGAVSLEAFAGQLKYSDSVSGDRSNLYALRAVYSFSKRSAAYITTGRINNHGNQNLSVSGASPGGATVPGGGQNGVLVGIRTTF